jgi:hypothetical protein
MKRGNKLPKNNIVIIFFIFLVGVLSLIGSISANISGTVLNSSALQNVIVEAWQGTILVTNTTTNSLGQYTLTGLTNGIQYTVRTYNFTKTTDNNPGDEGQCWNENYIGYFPKTQLATDPAVNINFNLNAFPTPTTSTEFTQFYGGMSTFAGALLKKGDVVTIKDTQGIITGLGVNCWGDGPGWYISWATGDAPGGSDEGSLEGELVNFFINEVAAVNISGSRTWTKGSVINAEISTTGGGAQCTFINASWNQSTATQGNVVTLSIDSTGCNGKNINFTVTEGGVVSRGNATIQPAIGAVDFSGIATVTWTAEFVNDAGGGDTNPPEYYFIAREVGNASNKIDSRTFGQYLNVSQDLTAPQILNPTLNLFGDNAIMSWDTNEPSTTQIDYGKTLSYGTSKINSTLSNNHMVVLNNLDLDTIYYYRIVSADTYGNTNNTINSSFIIISPATITLQEGAYGYYYGVKDTYLYSQGDLDLGGLAYIRLGQRLANGDYSHPILWFNTSFIGPSATITSARLELNMFALTEGTSSIVGDLYRVIRPWGAQGTGSSGAASLGMVSWNYSFYNTILWGLPGADQANVDRENTIQSTQTFTSSSPFGWYNWNLNTAMVQNWLITPSSNNGVVIKSPIIASATRYSFRSSEYTTQSERPRLVITFTKVPTVCADFNSDGTVNIKDLSIVIFNQGRNSGQGNWASYSHLNLDGDSDVDWNDVQIVMNRVGGVC